MNNLPSSNPRESMQENQEKTVVQELEEYVENQQTISTVFKV